MSTSHSENEPKEPERTVFVKENKSDRIKDCIALGR